MDQLIQVRGMALHATVRQREEPPSGTLVALHGFTGSAADWDTHFTELADSNWRIIALDLPGHGTSDEPDDPRRYAIKEASNDIIATLHAMEIDTTEAILSGYSMGGRIALYTALSATFKGVILESASPGLANEDERTARRINDTALAERIERDGIAAFVEYWEQLPLFASQQSLPAKTRADLHQRRLNNRPRGLANSLRGVGTGVQPSLYARLSEISCPVLLIAGELDTKFTTIARQMAATLPNAELAIVPGAGHTIHLEQPEKFDGLVKTFCENTKGIKRR
jgi:2-succinyl-6-hydroxy-2,4-cyclohexadiene-1-carboxylate synthase